MFSQLGKQQRGELAGGSALWVRCGGCEDGLGGIRGEKGDWGRAVAYKHGVTALAVGMEGIVMNPGVKPEVGFVGEMALKRDFVAFSTFSCQRYLSVTIQHNLILLRERGCLRGRRSVSSTGKMLHHLK